MLLVFQLILCSFVLPLFVAFIAFGIFSHFQELLD